jgi:spermidine synthase
MTTKSILHWVFLLSGFAALGLQLMWTRVFALGIGHELGSVLAIVTAFFGGLSLGAWGLSGPIGRSRRPGYWYAGLEGFIGAWGGISLLLIPVANRLIFRWVGLDTPEVLRWTICFLVPFLTLLPATFCMGGTLPAMERTVAGLSGGGREVPGLYAANTFGAVIGIFAAVFGAASLLGFRLLLLGFAGTALVCSLSAFVVARRPLPEGGSGSRDGLSPPRFNQIPAALFFTGLLGIGYEVVVTRALSQFFEDSIYTYSMLLMVYLLGTALGASAYKRLFRRAGFGETLAILLGGLGIACLAGAAALPAVATVDSALWNMLGQGRLAHFTGEMAGAAVIFLLPTVFMGATFSHLAQAAKERSLGLGRALAVNTLGGALAPFLFGILLLPRLGIRTTLISIGLGYFAFIRPFKAAGIALSAAAIPLAAAILVPWNLVTVPPGARLLEYREGAMSSVAVLEDEDGGKGLKVDNRLNMGGTQTLTTERLKTHLPLLLHPHPERALFIGLGTGITFGTVVDYITIAADGVELDPLVVDMLPNFSPFNRAPFAGKYKVFAADARRYVRATRSNYDMILADFFHPYRDGAATLYTLEHFEGIKSRLEPGGLFCQWLPLYQLDMPSLRIIIRTFLAAFPHARGFLGSFSADTPGLALVGGEEKRDYPSGWFPERVADPELRDMLDQEAISDGFRVPSFYLASQTDLERIAGDAPLNTDDCPRVMYINPGFSRLKDFTSYGRLDSLLDLCRHEPSGLAGNGEDSASRDYRENLGQMLAARDLFLRGAVAEAKGSGPEALALYLRSAGLSPHFTVGYAKCLTMAIEQREKHPGWAKDMLHKLAAMRPEIEDAPALLRELFNE